MYVKYSDRYKAERTGILVLMQKNEIGVSNLDNFLVRYIFQRRIGVIALF
jgi:hypothetical protein